MQQTAKLKKAPAYRFVVFIEMMLCYILIYAGIQMVATLGSEIMTYLNVAEGKLGVFSAIGNPAMAVMSVLAGALTSKFGGKKVLVTGLAVLAISGALYLTGTKSLAFLIVIRLIQGFGTGMVSATLMALVAVWFPIKERGTAHGVLACFYGASTSVVTAYAGIMAAKNMVWYQTAGYLLLVCGAALAVIVAFGYKDIEKTYGVHVIDEALEGYDPNAHVSESVETADPKANWARPDNWHDTLRHPAFWILGISLFFYCGSCFGTGFVLPMFLSYIGFDAAEQAAVMTYGSLGTIVFCLIGGVLADRVFKTKRTPVYMMAFGGAAIFTLVMFATGGSLKASGMSVLYFIMIGFANFSGGPAWVLPVEIVGPNMAQQNMGTCLLFSGMGGTIMLMIYGAVAERINAGASMLVLAGCMLITFILATVLNRKYHV